MWNSENKKSAQLGVKSVNIKFEDHKIQFHPCSIRLSCELKRKSAQLGVKSVNIKFIGHEFQFDPSFIPLSYEITKKGKSEQLGVKSANIKFIGHEFQFDPSFIPLSNEIMTIETRSGNRSGHSRMIFAGGSDPKLTLTPWMELRVSSLCIYLMSYIAMPCNL